jgi:hypothetical protein
LAAPALRAREQAMPLSPSRCVGSTCAIPGARDSAPFLRYRESDDDKPRHRNSIVWIGLFKKSSRLVPSSFADGRRHLQLMIRVAPPAASPFGPRWPDEGVTKREPRRRSAPRVGNSAPRRPA